MELNERGQTKKDGDCFRSDVSEFHDVYEWWLARLKI